MLRVKSLLLTVAFFGLALGNTAQAQVLDPSDDGIVPELSKHYRNNRVSTLPISSSRRYAMVRASLGAN